MDTEKKELIVNKNSMNNLFLEFLKIIDCEAKIGNNEIIIWDLFYTPTITMGGRTFTFDSSDIELNTLLGGNGKTYKLPFEYISNDNLRKIKCDKIGISNVFSVSEIIQDEKKKEIGTLNLKVAQEKKNSIEIHIPQKDINVHFNFSVNNKYIECTISFFKIQIGIDEEIKIKYRKDKNSNEKELMLSHNYLNRIDSENGYSTYAHFKENNQFYASDNRNGNFIIHHKNSLKRDKLKDVELNSRELDLYFEDLCFHTKELISILIQNFRSLSPTFLNILFLNYPDFKEFIEVIENSQDKGIINNIFKSYYKNKEQLPKNDNMRLLFTSTK